MSYSETMAECGRKDYDRIFWNHMRGHTVDYDKLKNSKSLNADWLNVPSETNGKYEKALMRESAARQLCSLFSRYGGTSKILAAESDDLAEFVPEFGGIEVREVLNDFQKLPVERYKLATMLRLPTEFVTDAAFDLESYLIRRLAKCFGRAEDKAFITGTGVGEPTGLLHDTDGAETGTSAALSYDSVIDLYFSVKPEYRKNGVWIMNDETAHALKKLKDDSGNYLWRGSDDTIMGKPVVISEYMPDAESGAKPLLFGDFSYYWLVKRSPVTVKVIKELFALNGQTAYLAFEFLDGKLIRRDAVKALQIGA